MECGWNSRLGTLLLDPRWKAGEYVVNDTEELIYELQDQVQSLNRKVNRLLSHHGIDPEEAGRLPDEQPGERKAA